MFLILYRYQYIIVEMSTYIIGTHFAFGLNRFGLTLVEFTNGLTAPQDVTHSWVTHAHHAHRYQVGEHGENDVVSTFENIPSCQCLSTVDPQENIWYNLMALYITWNLVARLTEAHPARRRYKQFEFHRLNICGMKIIKWNIIFTHIIWCQHFTDILWVWFLLFSNIYHYRADDEFLSAAIHLWSTKMNRQGEPQTGPY